MSKNQPPPTITVTAHYFRFLYRRPGELGYTVLAPGVPALTTRSTADALCAEWQMRDHGKLEWKADEVLPGSFDHPDSQDTST